MTIEYEELSERALARRTGKSPKTIQGWVAEGLPCYQTGKRTKTFLWHEYQRWLRSRRVQPRDRTHVETRAAELLNEEARHGR